ncbi:MAG: 16S rRNA (cytosine(967)-C(5))-methyltransferase RsmB [Gammaproteobacteria bacterium]|nr:16S rRNA (cytosine(967)-C(5))-methyltransferase RsmB [Gammaproteobacteria bacterium]
MNPRLTSVYVLQQILQQGRNLPDALKNVIDKKTSPQDHALIQALCYGVVRYYFALDVILQQLLQKPLKEKDSDIRCLLLSGLYQIIYMRIPDHAAVSETVNLTRNLKKNWAKGMVNAVLRNYLRQSESLLQQVQEQEPSRYSHPQWLLDLFKNDWPDHWQSITESNNQLAPMTLRVNRKQCSRDEYLNKLIAAGLTASACHYSGDGILLEHPVAVEKLPDFEQGVVSVQDEAAQLATLLLAPAVGDRILDACAAPGGKTAHILESQPELTRLDALELKPGRINQIIENLQRLKLSANIIQGDAAEPARWWDKRPYDRILLDAPCSATGVIRRHPDIRLLRRADDIKNLVTIQQQMLNALWPLLKSGGMLLYTTCSILRQENTRQIQNFLEAHSDARFQNINVEWGQQTAAGQQLLPGEEKMDGFFYACLYKA